MGAWSVGQDAHRIRCVSNIAAVMPMSTIVIVMTKPSKSIKNCSKNLNKNVAEFSVSFCTDSTVFFFR